MKSSTALTKVTRIQPVTTEEKTLAVVFNEDEIEALQTLGMTNQKNRFDMIRAAHSFRNQNDLEVAKMEHCAKLLGQLFWAANGKDYK
jgi:hypothetical protein